MTLPPDQYSGTKSLYYNHLRSVINAIDEAFGPGYARDHPELVAAMVHSGTIHAAVVTGRGAHDEALSMAQSLTAQICETLLRLKPRFFG